MDDGNITVGELADIAARASGLAVDQVREVVLLVHAHVTPGKCSTRVAITGTVDEAIETLEHGRRILGDERYIRDTINMMEGEL